ncbi:MAG: IS21 family transposase, partial [Candidatus Hatepunaea meridiana]|nr:IS21 family transposase [Candidatus Hatepunaea meridiana]
MQSISNGQTYTTSAAKAGMDEKTARKYRNLDKLPSEVKVDHTWRTREDPFADVWSEVVPKLSVNPGLESKTLFSDLQRRYPGRFQDGQLRTFQRLVKRWRATEGPSREIFFPQVHHPGELCESDFTHMDSLGITINGQLFSHMIYHFVLTYSNWETGTICFSESFESLSQGLQNALCSLGGVPRSHRTDRLSSAVKKADSSQ